MIAFIGGSGFEKFDGFVPVQNLNRETPFGTASSGFKKVKINNQEALFVSRHGDHHELLPTEVNYRANIFALKKAGAKAILSFSAIGSLREELKPGDLVVPYQYIDRTKGLRKHTFLGEGAVGHVSLAHPMSETLAMRTKELVQGKPWKTHFGQCYVCIEGPYFSTKSESHSYRAMGADIIGMTHFPEFALAREAGLPYLPLCFVTDYDCWKDDIPHVTLEEVIKIMRQNNGKAFDLTCDILKLGSSFWANCPEVTQGLATGLMSPKEALTKQQQEWLNVLTT